MGVTDVPTIRSNKQLFLKSVQANVPDSTKFTVPMVAPSVNNPKKIIPQDIKEQLEIVFDNTKFEMEYIPKWLYVFGVNKIKRELTQMIDSKNFKEELKIVFEQSRIKYNFPNKDVVELLKKREVYNQVYDCIHANTKEKSLLNKIMKFDYVKERFYKMVQKGSADNLLYGDYSQ